MSLNESEAAQVKSQGLAFSILMVYWPNSHQFRGLSFNSLR